MISCDGSDLFNQRPSGLLLSGSLRSSSVEETMISVPVFKPKHAKILQDRIFESLASVLVNG